MKQHEWLLKKVDNELDAKSLADSLNISDILARLLVLRNIRTFAQAKKFFRPTISDMHDPFLMNGMDIATHRVIEAITHNQKILIYGDYDVDGTCSTALLYMFLKKLGASVDFYIPKRLEEGYGISNVGIDYAKQIGTELMISVDCGVTAVNEIDYANSVGLDVIICDHHQPKDVIPRAYAVLDPLKPGCEYPFKYLSGAGVALKLAQGVCKLIGKNELPLQFLDLAALAGAADIVPLADENRIIVREGLIQINLNPRPGIKALIQTSRLDPGTLSSGQIVFTLAPRINAVGRLGDARTAVELLITEDEVRAKELAYQLESDNTERKKIDEETVGEAMKYIEDNLLVDDDRVLILHGPHWHPGVIGIVASRIVEKYYKPTIMLTTIDGMAKGSARSILNFNIYEALRECEDLLVHFGGHEAAAGLAIELDKLDEFRDRFKKIVARRIDDKIHMPPIDVDASIKLSEITPKFLRIMEQFSPFGPANMRPFLMSTDVESAGQVRSVGANGKHLMLSLKQAGSDRVFDAVGFDLGEFAQELNNGHRIFDMVFSLDQKVKDGKVYPQIRIRDIKLKEINRS